MKKPSETVHIYCPVCSVEREKPFYHFPWVAAVLFSLLWAGVAGIVVGLVAGVSVGAWAGLFFGMLCFLGIEVYYNLKFKRELECPVCHFDPLLYRRAPEEAKKRCLEGVEGTKKTVIERWRELQSKDFAEEIS